MLVKMVEFGTVLGTRVAGREAYRVIMDRTDGLSEATVFDFSGVTTITNSFADEVFGRMVVDMGMDSLRARTSFKNIGGVWARVVRRAMDAHVEEFALASA
ncbi:STAS-like domain-containing protein [Collinsella intestinalis]|uniref:STAS-like domain-containing protein n=1 Tax=Collinsella intestinalis TaxID=147207 RepID=UPI0022E1C8FD|nr:STAS-like domain-containing protein [Collinsella intestinalis]